MKTERPTYKCKKCDKILVTSRGVIRHRCAKEMDIHHLSIEAQAIVLGFKQGQIDLANQQQQNDVIY